MATLFPPDTITCLSLHQPYAGLVAWGAKPLETRVTPWPSTRPFPHPILICASAQRDDGAFDRLHTRIMNADPKGGLWALCMQHKVALALVDVVGAHKLTAEDEPRSWWWDGAENRRKPRWAYELAEVRRVVPFTVSGLQGFGRSVPMTLVDAARIAYVALHVEG